MTAQQRWLSLEASPERATVDDDIPVGVFEFGLQLLTDATMASFAGEIDQVTFPRFAGALSLLLNDGAPTLLLDLRQVRFISTRGLLALAQAMERSRGEGAVVRLQAGRAVARTAATLGVSDTLSAV
jgi:anti-anti-sigma factor